MSNTLIRRSSGLQFLMRHLYDGVTAETQKGYGRLIRRSIAEQSVFVLGHRCSKKSQAHQAARGPTACK